MKKRSYRQFCAVAHALDVVGERWTLLLVRELLAGPRRYSDLLNGLPGIGTNLLAARLRELEAAGLIERSMLPPPASSSVYSLTRKGLALRGVVMGLGAWAADSTVAPARGEVVRPWWSLLLLNGRFYKPGANVPADLAESYELHADGEVFHVDVAGGRLAMGQGAARDPALVVTTDGETLASVLARRHSISAVVESGDATIEGDPKALKRLERLFDLTQSRAR